MSKPDQHNMMRAFTIEVRPILKPTGSMVVVLQPNYEKGARWTLVLGNSALSDEGVEPRPRRLHVDDGRYSPDGYKSETGIAQAEREDLRLAGAT